MSSSPTRRALVAAGSSTIAAAMLLALPGSADAAATRAFGGSAYGSTVKIGSIVNSGKTSYVPMCTKDSSYTKTNTTAAINEDGLAEIGVANTRVRSSKSGSKIASTTTSRTADTELLDGLVSFDALTSTAKVSYVPGDYSTYGSSVFTDLRIAGLPVSARPAKNSEISIPGVATVKLNAQSTSSSAGLRSQTTTALKVTLLSGNTLGLPGGATIVVGYAKASLNAPTFNRPYGNAFGTQLDVGGLVKSGATAAVYLPCGGSNGATKRNDVASVDLSPALEVGAITTYAKSSDSSTTTAATTGARAAGVDLLDGVVTVQAVEAKATATRKGSSIATSSSGTRVVGLRINGVSRSVSSAENSKITIAGVGTLHLRRAVRTSTGVQVYAVQLKLSSDQGDLDAGTTLTVGAAKAGVSRG